MKQKKLLKKREMAEDQQNGNIVKKKKCRKPKEEPGSAWEIAYGDFMTSMMAFFLVMWVVAATNVQQRQVISYYYTHPGAVSMLKHNTGAPSKGIFNIGSKEISISHIPSQSPMKRGSEVSGPNKVSIAFIKGKKPTKTISRNNFNNLLKELIGIKNAVSKGKNLAPYKSQIKMNITEKGLEIIMFDKNNKPMFKKGSAELEPYAKKIIGIVADNLKKIPNKIIIEGHTSSVKYIKSTLSNWNLSTMRANSTRYVLQQSGISHNRIDSVAGYAGTRPMPGTSPDDPINRRVVIIVKNL